MDKSGIGRPGRLFFAIDQQIRSQTYIHVRDRVWCRVLKVGRLDRSGSNLVEHILQEVTAQADEDINETG